MGPVSLEPGDTLSIRLAVRNACTGRTHNSGTARLWYGDTVAGTQFEATVDDLPSKYFLRAGDVLDVSPGTGQRATTDVFVDSKEACSGRAFKPFGTWAATASANVAVWSPSQVTKTIGDGTVVSPMPVTFTVAQRLDNVDLFVVPSVQGLVGVQPSTFAVLLPSTTYTVTLSFSVPTRAATGVYSGTIRPAPGLPDDSADPKGDHHGRLCRQCSGAQHSNAVTRLVDTSYRCYRRRSRPHLLRRERRAAGSLRDHIGPAAGRSYTNRLPREDRQRDDVW